MVADDEAAGSALMRAAMLLVVPEELELKVARVDATDHGGLAKDGRRTLMLRVVAAVVVARRLGLPPGPLNLGNVHAGGGRSQVSRSVFLTAEERTQLKQLGMQITVQAVPGEAATPLPGWRGLSAVSGNGGGRTAIEDVRRRGRCSAVVTERLNVPLVESALSTRRL